MPGDFVNVITPEGKTVAIPTDALASTLARDPRYRIESVAQEADRAAKLGERRHLKGTARAIEAGVTSVLSGATLGGFDALAAASGQGDHLGDVRREHSTISAGGEILGALATAIPTGGASIERQIVKRGAQEAVERVLTKEAIGAAERGGLREVASLTPSGALSGFSARVAERGAEAGAVKSTAYKALGGAIEGTGQSVGAYVSDVALGDRDLSAEGLAGAVGTGALLGGGTSAAFGVSERALSRARDLFPKSQVTRELAEQSEQRAASAVTSMMDDAAELERRAQGKLDDIKAVRGQDPAVQAHAAQLRVEREARAAAQRAQAESRALTEAEKARAAGARADLAGLRLDRAKNPPPRAPRGSRTPKGTPADGVPEHVVDDAAVVASPEVSDLERALLATSKRIDEGADINALNLERRGALAVDDLEDAVVAADPGAAKLRELVAQTRMGREGVQEYLAAFRKRADDLADAQVAKGLIKRDDDVIRTLEGGRDVFGAKVGAAGNAGADARAVRSRLRKPYTDEELIAKAERNPTFVDVGDAAPGSVGSRMSARDDLVERIVSGKTSPASLQVEDLLPRIDETTGEVLPGLRREMRAATGDDIIRAVEMNRRDPQFASYVSDDVMRALRGRLDMPDDLAQAIPAISRLEKAEADLAEHLGAAAAPPASVQRAAELRAARTSHAETQALADAQKIAAIDDAALPVVQGAVAKAEAADIAAGVGAGEKASKLADAAAAIEVMSSLGIPGLPNASNIPIVGPVLGLYLKARAGMGVWRKFGGKMPASVESVAARKSAQTRERVATAVRSMLDGASKSAGRNSIRGAATTEILARNVFGGEAKKRYRPTETMAEMWERHRAEIAASKQPGAIERVLRERVPTGDPRLAQSLASLARRRLAYLDEKMPRPPAGGIDPDLPPWHPTEAQAEQWASIVDATDDPAGVLERAAAGDVSVDQIDAVRAVFPKLYAEAQLAVIEGVASGKSIPYQRRVQLGAIFGLPLAPTQDAEFAAAMQASYAAPPPDAPTPRPSANVDLAGPALLQEEQP